MQTTPAPAACHCAIDPTGRRVAERVGLRHLVPALTLLLTGAWAGAQTFPNLPISPAQRETAQQVAQAGVPLSALAPNAPERHTVRRGDTLWDISAIFLRQPWRWPELWGMNLEQIRNPHLIFPGQVLVLTRVGDRAFLALEAGGAPPTVRLSPRIRSETLADAALPAIPAHMIAPFLTDSQVLSADTHARAPRIVAAPEGRTLFSRGDRVYARGQSGPLDALEGRPLLSAEHSQSQRIYRNAEPLIDPSSGEKLGYEAKLIGSALLVGSETLRPHTRADGTTEQRVEPASVDISAATEEIRVGDRLLATPVPPQPASYVPRAPQMQLTGRIVRTHGHAQRMAGQYQVVVLNRGSRDGLEAGHVLALHRSAAVLTDRTDSARATMQLPAERNGLMMVFRTFDRVSYALVLNVADAVRNGDHFATP